MIIAIDGPAGAGKSTVAKRIAQKMGFLYIDTGAMYRAITLKAMETGVDIKAVAALTDMARNTSVNLTCDKGGSLKVLLDGADVSLKIRQPAVNQLVSDVAKIKELREVMAGLQRKLGEKGDSVLEGRDIGTVVVPNAEKKFYLDAKFEERVNRRYKESTGSSGGLTPDEVASDLHNRDHIDSTRKVAPLRKAKDAIYVDTTYMNIDEVVEKILSYITGKTN